MNYVLLAEFNVFDRRVLVAAGIAMILVAIFYRVRKKMDNLREHAQKLSDELKLYELNFSAGFLDAFARDDEAAMIEHVKTAVAGVQDEAVRMTTLRNVQKAATRRLWERGTAEDKQAMVAHIAQLDSNTQYSNKILVKQPTVNVEAPE